MSAAEFVASLLYSACANVRTDRFAQDTGMSHRGAFLLLRDAEVALLRILGLHYSWTTRAIAVQVRVLPFTEDSARRAVGHDD